MKYIILAIIALTLTQCATPYDTYVVPTTTSSAKGTTTVQQPVNVIQVQRYYTPNYRYYTRPYLNCAPHYYRRRCYSPYWY